MTTTPPPGDGTDDTVTNGVTISAPTATDAPAPIAEGESGRGTRARRARRRRRGKGRHARTRVRPWWQAILIAVVTVALVIPLSGVVTAVLTPQNLSYTERAAEWMRDNNLGGVLNSIENWWLSNHQAKEGGEPDRAIGIELPAGETSSTVKPKVVAPHLAKPADVPVPFGVTPLTGEGVWRAVGPEIGGAQSMYFTQVRPDSVHTSILDGLAWMDPLLVSFEVFPGTEEPGGKWDKPAQVPMDRRVSLLAAFNMGFRMQDAMGGFYLDGVTRKPLRDGAASFVVYKNGFATVGEWGRDVTMTPDVAAVRQNLDLIVDNGGGPPTVPGLTQTATPGHLVDGLTDNADGKWGATFGNKILAWRSAVGVTATGAVVYGYGDGLGALALANLMLRAGCVRAMELDINTVWTTFNFYTATRFLDPTSVEGTKLLPESFKPANRYLSNDARDFAAVFARTL